MTDPLTKTITSGRITEISQSGCFAEVSNPPGCWLPWIQLWVSEGREDAIRNVGARCL